MWNTIAWLGVGSAVVASLMELIKFKVYDNKATKVKMTLLGLLFSGVLSPVLYFGLLLIKAHQWQWCYIGLSYSLYRSTWI